jgi:hypothetical protein
MMRSYHDAVVSDRVDHLVHEPLSRDVRKFQVPIVVEHVLPHGMHQVGLAKPHTAVDEQRVVRARRRLRDCPAGGMRELIRGSDDEAVKRIAWIQTGRAWRG